MAATPYAIPNSVARLSHIVAMTFQGSVLGAAFVLAILASRHKKLRNGRFQAARGANREQFAWTCVARVSLLMRWPIISPEKEADRSSVASRGSHLISSTE